MGSFVIGGHGVVFHEHSGDRIRMTSEIYLETTIISYYTARPSRDVVIAGRRETTREVWPVVL